MRVKPNHAITPQPALCWSNNEPVKIIRTPLPLVMLKALAWIAYPWLSVLVKIVRCFGDFYG